MLSAALASGRLTAVYRTQATAVACTRLSLLQLPATLSVKCIPVQPGAGMLPNSQSGVGNACSPHLVLNESGESKHVQSCLTGHLAGLKVEGGAEANRVFTRRRRRVTSTSDDWAWN